MSEWDIREPNGEGNGFKVGLAWIGEDLQGKGRAAANLIAAAPELYEALQVALACHVGSEEIWLDEARAALAKARGEA